jgi:hypothetical protein
VGRTSPWARRAQGPSPSGATRFGSAAAMAFRSAPEQNVPPLPHITAARASGSASKVTMPLQDMSWGNRYGQLTDPFGHTWSIAKHLEDLSPDEIKKGAMKGFAERKEMKK